MLGLFLLTVSLTVASCQAFFHTLTRLEATPADPQEISGNR
jgi:hypothetical protein